ncbi:SPOR domain-containing protein [Ramlibacter sp. H39-3-26]|uniref:SPOR domain-containing protein n=1 Tax=Curvibacter soli TaxID=3031331 RepID=UPI0023DC4056|nr:SPOR domain-containing protein [Ramlibacter sp. H39-3-26]MDF1485255.1 SPOR domain-containing protein [Ramlibacter sp. H39-3-26]
MAFFKFRWPGAKEQGDKPAPKVAKAPARTHAGPSDSVELLRRRARHRLIGAAALVLIGVVGFPLLFDTQPRPIPVDIPIVVPDRNQAMPLVAPPAVSAAAPEVAAPAATVAAAPPAPAVAPVPQPPVPPREEIVSASARTESGKEPQAAVPPAPATVAPPVLPKEPPAVPKPGPKVQDKPPAATPSRDSSARAQALLEGKVPTAADGRFVVQVGAFSDQGKAREVRQRVEKAGLKTYTQTVETKDGPRTRVRVGPFATRAEADRAASRIKGLDLPAAILAL